MRDNYLLMIQGQPLGDLLRYYSERTMYDAEFVTILMEEFDRRQIDPEKQIHIGKQYDISKREEISNMTINELLDMLNYPYKHRRVSDKYFDLAHEIINKKIRERIMDGQTEYEAVLLDFYKKQKNIKKWHKYPPLVIGFGNYINIGTKLYGKRDFEKDGSYITTLWFVILYLPIFPLWSLRVLPDGGETIIPGLIMPFSYNSKQFYILDGSSPHKMQVINTYLIVWLPLIIIFLLFFIGAKYG